MNTPATARNNHISNLTQLYIARWNVVQDHLGVDPRPELEVVVHLAHRLIRIRQLKRRENLAMSNCVDQREYALGLPYRASCTSS